MTAVQGHALGAAAVGAPVQLRYALEEEEEEAHGGEDFILKTELGGGGVMPGHIQRKTHSLLLLHQLGREVLMELLLLHVHGLDLHAVLQHVDVVGLSVHWTWRAQLRYTPARLLAYRHQVKGHFIVNSAICGRHGGTKSGFSQAMVLANTSSKTKRVKNTTIISIHKTHYKLNICKVGWGFGRTQGSDHAQKF